MNVFSRYLAYLKNNPEHYWFRRKIWGWGWVPATWEGWTTLAVFIAVLIAMVTSFARTTNPSDAEMWYFAGKVFLWAAVLLIVCYVTGEPPRLQWGFPEEY